MLRFFCATAGESFDSGIFIDEKTFATQRLKIVAVNCPLCERKHRYLLADAEFRAEEVAA